MRLVSWRQKRIGSLLSNTALFTTVKIDTDENEYDTRLLRLCHQIRVHNQPKTFVQHVWLHLKVADPDWHHITYIILNRNRFLNSRTIHWGSDILILIIGKRVWGTYLGGDRETFMGRFRQIEAETMECLHNQRTFKRMGFYMQQVHQSLVGIT